MHRTIAQASLLYRRASEGMRRLGGRHQWNATSVRRQACNLAIGTDNKGGRGGGSQEAAANLSFLGARLDLDFVASSCGNEGLDDLPNHREEHGAVDDKNSGEHLRVALHYVDFDPFLGTTVTQISTTVAQISTTVDKTGVIGSQTCPTRNHPAVIWPPRE